MTLLDFMLVWHGHQQAFGPRQGGGSNAPDMETHKKLVARYG